MKIISGLMAVLLLSACATAPTDVSLKPQLASAARVARVFLFVPENRAMGLYHESTAGQQFGAIGMILDGIETASAHNKMLKVVAPIHRITSDLDFRRDLQTALRNSGLFMASNAVQILEKPPADEGERKALLASARGIPIVWIDATQHFDPSFHSLVIKSRLALHLTPEAGESYAVRTFYHSAPVGPDRVAVYFGPRQIGQWAANGARRFRAAYAEGIAETVRMLRIALLERPSNLAGPNVRIHKYSYYNSPNRTISEGKRIHAGRDRDIFLTEYGDYYSVSTGPTYASITAKLTAPGTGHGRVFFYSAYKVGVPWIQPSIYLNGIKVGELWADTFIFKDLRPGRYKIELKYNGDSPGATIARSQMRKITPAEINLVGSSRAFVKFEGYQGIFTKNDALKIVPQSTAESEMQPLRYFQ